MVREFESNAVEFPKQLLIAGWRVDADANRLEKDGKEVRLEPRVMQVLLYLAENVGQAVSRDELMSKVWSDCFVGDDALNGAVSKLRKALANGEQHSKIIETIPKVGYSLIAPVEVAPKEKNGWHLKELETQINTLPIKSSPFWLLGIGVFVLLFSSLVFGWWFWSKNPISSANPKIFPATSFQGIEVTPDFSPSGDRVVFAWRGEKQDNWEIYVQVIGTDKPLKLTNNPAIDYIPKWSPDGRFIAFGHFSQGKCEIRQIPAFGGDDTKLTDCNYHEIPALSWSPDGKFLAFPDRKNSNEPFQITIFSLETQEKRIITNPPAGTVGDIDVTFSPDGKTLAIRRSPVLGVEDIWTVDVKSGETLQVTKDNVKNHGLDWTPDGKSLVYSSNRNGTFSLWQIDVIGGEPKWLGTTGGNADAPSVSADGKRIAFEFWQDETNIYQLNLKQTAEKPTKLLFSSRWDWNPSFSPDGKQIVFISDRLGTSEIWTADQEGGNLMQRTSFGAPLVTSPKWSPDGNKIVFDARIDGNADIWILNKDEAKPSKLTNDSAEETSPVFSNDGKWIYFTSKKSGDLQIWKLAVEGGEAIQVTKNGALSAKESRDGKNLYFVHPSKGGLWQMNLETSEETLLFNELKPVDRDNWAISGDSIYFAHRPNSDQAVLSSYDLKTKKIETIKPLEKFFFRSGITISPDGNSLLFSRIDRWESDIMILER